MSLVPKGLPDKPDGNEMVAHQLVVIFPWFLETEKKNEKLLDPKGRLHEIVRFQLGFHLPVRIA
jgi:hypothetical protein